MYHNVTLDDLGLDPKRFTWQDLSSCQGVNTELFFDEYEGATAKQIDAMCLACPVVKKCLLAGIEGSETGVWGGFYLVLGKVDKTKNAHKTEEFMSQLADKVYK